jgi:hypothetical protein
MFSGQIRAPATLPNYVHMHIMNSSYRHPVIFETSPVCFYTKQHDLFPSREMFCTGSYSDHPAQTTHFTVKPHSLWQALLLQEVSSWRRASYKNFLTVYPARTPTEYVIQRYNLQFVMM